MKSKFAAGFTIYELLISISLMAIIAAVVLYNHSQFSSDIEITNLAYRIALNAREAQVYSVSVRQRGGETAGIAGFDISYGLHFDQQKKDSFILFSDLDGDDLYTFPSFGNDDCDTVSSDSECVEQVLIGRGNIISTVCGIHGPADPPACFDPSGHGMRFADIRFKRPNPDAILTGFGPDYIKTDIIPKFCPDRSTGQDVECTAFAICLKSPQARYKRVVVYNTGQISVESVKSNELCDQT